MDFYTGNVFPILIFMVTLHLFGVSIVASSGGVSLYGDIFVYFLWYLGGVPYFSVDILRKVYFFDRLHFLGQIYFRWCSCSASASALVWSGRFLARVFVWQKVSDPGMWEWIWFSRVIFVVNALVCAIDQLVM